MNSSTDTSDGAPAPAPLPTRVRRVDHLSFTVGDVDRSAAFYRRFGFEPHKRYTSAGPEVDEGADTEDAEMDIQWLVHPLGGPMLELIRYVNHEAGRSAHNSKVGAAHLCFCVEDVNAAFGALVSEGVEPLSDPNEDEFGVRWVYLRDPDGNAVELIQDPPEN
ncbi:MAG: VOC family protein [Actinobacteria bacterium]|nr:VOC family protein [Actinomycetota bacterium]